MSQLVTEYPHLDIELLSFELPDPTMSTFATRLGLSSSSAYFLNSFHVMYQSNAFGYSRNRSFQKSGFAYSDLSYTSEMSFVSSSGAAGKGSEASAGSGFVTAISAADFD